MSQSPLKKKDATPNKPPAAQIRRSSVPKGHQNGVVLSPIKTGGKENDGNLDNTSTQIPITKESSSDTPSPRGDSYLATKNLKVKIHHAIWWGVAIYYFRNFQTKVRIWRFCHSNLYLCPTKNSCSKRLRNCTNRLPNLRALTVACKGTLNQNIAMFDAMLTPFIHI